MKKRIFKSYPGGAGMSGNAPAHQVPIICVDPDWVRAHGNRAQRRRIRRALKEQDRKINGRA
jgi:hypothetical protein